VNLSRCTPIGKVSETTNESERVAPDLIDPSLQVLEALFQVLPFPPARRSAQPPSGATDWQLDDAAAHALRKARR
jgi:hypothetical protein